MNQNILTLRSTIKPALMHHALMRGTALSAIGVLFLFLGGAYIPPDFLKIWGFPIFIIGIALITWGMLPYRKLRRLEINPYCIIMDSTESLYFSIKGKPTLSLALGDIAHIEYIEKNNVYGIGIILKENLSKKLIVYDLNFNLEAFRKKSIKEHSCDLFLPYFSKYSYRELQETLSL